MCALLNPVSPVRRGIRWVLVAHTVAMFSFLTISFGLDRNWLSIIYINDREFLGNDEYPPGPLGYGITLTANIKTMDDCRRGAYLMLADTPRP